MTDGFTVLHNVGLVPPLPGRDLQGDNTDAKSDTEIAVERRVELRAIQRAATCTPKTNKNCAEGALTGSPTDASGAPRGSPVNTTHEGRATTVALP